MVSLTRFSLPASEGLHRLDPAHVPVIVEVGNLRCEKWNSGRNRAGHSLTSEAAHCAIAEPRTTSSLEGANILTAAGSISHWAVETSRLCD